MIVARQVFQARYGRGDELVALFQELNSRMQKVDGATRFRILTDASGPFFTVVTEAEVESLAAWEGSFRESMSQPWMSEWFERMVPLVESGSREFYNVVE
jgi:quinol monooxygenase YgiN